VRELAANTSVRRAVISVLTIAAWGGVVWTWSRLYFHYVQERSLGFDLLFAWRAERLFAHGGQPYSITAFVYPPSSLLLFRPIAGLSQHELMVGGLVATLLVAGAAVMITAAALGFRWWGPMAAGSLLVLSYSQAFRGELPLENVSVLEFFAIALFFLLALRDRWLAAAAVIGVSIAVKPMLVPVVLVLLVSRRWKATAVALGVPVVLNAVALAVVAGPLQVLHKLPSLLNRTGSGAAYNSAWVDVARALSLPEAATVALRIFMLVATLVVAWWCWQRLADERLRLVTTTTVLVIGEFTAGTLSEYHYMLILVPLAMTVVVARSPMRFPVALLGMAWALEFLSQPRSWFGLDQTANDSTLRAVGMSLVVLAIGGVLVYRRARSPGAAAPAARLAEAPD
jgi:arabinofuranan 3-O-arabinosyltransferase